MLLTLDSIVKVNVAIAAASVVASQRFDVGLIVATTASAQTGGPSSTVRAKVYETLADVVVDFAATTDTYKEAEKYFGATPTPRGLVIGYAGSGESPETVLSAIRDVTTDWYGVYWHGANASQIGQIDTYLNQINTGIQFYPATGVPATIVGQAPLSTLYEAKSVRSFGMYVAEDAKEVCAVMGTVMGCSNTLADRPWQLCYREINGMTPASLLETQIANLLSVNANVYVTRASNINLLERGATASGLRVDEVINIDRMAADIRDALIELMMTGKLPQNDGTTTQFMSAITEVLEVYVANGTIDRGVWRGQNIGDVSAGDMLDRGYVLHAESFDNQTPADRIARKGMPISVGVILSGSVESVEINVTVQQ